MVVAAAAKKVDDPDRSSAFGSLKAQYQSLSPKGKLVTGAAVGFLGSRLALGTVTKVVKIGAGAYIVYVPLMLWLSLSFWLRERKGWALLSFVLSVKLAAHRSAAPITLLFFAMFFFRAKQTTTARKFSK